MEVAALFRYPVKSLGGESLSAAEPQGRGFAGDRRWMFVDADGRFISQRTRPRLARYRAELPNDTGLRIVRIADGVPILSIEDARPAAEPDLEVKVWDDTFRARSVAVPNLKAVTEELAISGARLVYMNPEVHRSVDPRYAPAGAEVSFADGYPYLVTNTSSLSDLSERIGESLSMLRFRPNIVVTGAPAFAEDDWRGLEIGVHHFQLPKPCARCIMVTHEPQTGEKNLRVLSELAAYRKVGNKVLFGMNAVHQGGIGPIRVGDRVRAAT